MQANIELTLKTREVFKLFERRIDGGRLFVEAILRRFNVVMRQCKQQVPGALVTYNQMEQDIIALTQQFGNEVSRFEAVLASQKDFGRNTINFIAQFHPTITVSTPLSIRLIEFIEIYDKLIAIIKLLHLLGFFTTDSNYCSNIKRIQKYANYMLSNVML